MRFRILATAAFLGSCSAAAASVDIVSEGTIQEIIVTAQKRAESSQSVPVALTALTGEELAARQIRNSSDLEQLAPSLTWKPSSGVGASIGLRGVVDTVFTTNQVGSVGIVVDEVGLNSPIANTFALLDLERIEILRGPQVTLYGRSTTGGAINIITRQPRPEDGTNGYARLTAGRFDAREAEAAMGTALGDSWAVRVAALTQQRDGFMENPILGTRDWDRDRWALRAALAGQWGERASLLLKAHVAGNRGQNYRYKSVGLLESVDGTPCSRISNADPGNGCVDGGGFSDSGDFSTSYSNFPNPVDDIDSDGASINFTIPVGSVDLTSITAYEDNRLRRAEDNDGGPLSLAEVYYSAQVTQWTQELRLANQAVPGAIRWLAGAYFLKEEQQGLTAAVIREATQVGPPPQLRSLAFDQDDTIYSAYGQVDFPITPRFTFTLGGRYSEETKEGVGETLRAPGPVAALGLPPLGTFIDEAIARAVAVGVDVPPPEFIPATGPFIAPFEKTMRNWGGKAGLSFQWNERSLLYGSVSRGFKGGTFNFAAAVRLSSPLQRQNFQRGVDPETLTTYELGAKLQSPGRTLRLNLAAFRNDYTDQQTFTFKDGGPVLVNAAASTIDGFEAELEWRPSRGLRVSASAGWLDARYDQFVDTDGTVYSGNRMLQAPRWTGLGAVRQSWAVADAELSVQGSVHYTDDQYFGVDNAPVTLVRGQSMLDVQAELKFGSEHRYSLALWGRNLADKRFCSYTGAVPFGLAQCIPNEQRTYGATVAARF